MNVLSETIQLVKVELKKVLSEKIHLDKVGLMKVLFRKLKEVSFFQNCRKALTLGSQTSVELERSMF
jgi:hypothetical protein